MRQRLLLASIVLFAAASGWTQPPSDPFLAMGLRQVQDGDFEAAVFTLDSVIRKLALQPGRKKELVQAYVYFGAAYVGLDHDDAAKGKFRQALELEPDLRLSPEEFSPRVIKVFNTQMLKRTAAEKRRGARLVLILGGAGAAAAVGVAAATNEGGLPPNRPPTASIGVAPEGDALAGVTTTAFTASASDPDGDALTYRWDFGDGATAEGASITHLYRSEGTFSVTLTASDGRGGSVTSSSRVTARTMNGSWRNNGAGGGAPFAYYECVQMGVALDCPLVPSDCGGRCWLHRLQGTLDHPRRIVANLKVGGDGPIFNELCTGDVSSDLNVVQCLTVGGIRYVLERR